MHLKIYTAAEHGLDPASIDRDAVEIITKLQARGHLAYLVGGGVRDLLLQRKPKDFDISTSATPEMIKEIFQRRCLLIGRRFRLAHIRCGGSKIIEVSTFRAGDLESSQLIRQDNLWGDEEEDVLRRDFTINALYYDPAVCEVRDYVGGFQDIKAALLRTVGDPVVRFKQDPVRMIRLIKFRARFHLGVDEKVEQALCACREEITKSSPERLTEEILRMLESGSACRFIELLHQYGFLEVLFPCFHHVVSGSMSGTALRYLQAIDELQAAHGLLDRAVLLGALVYPILEQELKILATDRQVSPSFGEVLELSNALLHGIDTSSFVHFPRRLLTITHHIMANQMRLTPLHGTPRFQGRFVRHPDFALAMQLFHVRREVDPSLAPLYRQWQEARA